MFPTQREIVHGVMLSFSSDSSIFNIEERTDSSISEDISYLHLNALSTILRTGSRLQVTSASSSILTPHQNESR